jgi:hypothetical protein
VGLEGFEALEGFETFEAEALAASRCNCEERDVDTAWDVVGEGVGWKKVEVE